MCGPFAVSGNLLRQLNAHRFQVLVKNDFSITYEDFTASGTVGTVGQSILAGALGQRTGTFVARLTF